MFLCDMMKLVGCDFLCVFHEGRKGCMYRSVCFLPLIPLCSTLVGLSAADCMAAFPVVVSQGNPIHVCGGACEQLNTKHPQGAAWARGQSANTRSPAGSKGSSRLSVSTSDQPPSFFCFLFYDATVKSFWLTFLGNITSSTAF